MHHPFLYPILVHPPRLDYPVTPRSPMHAQHYCAFYKFCQASIFGYAYRAMPAKTENFICRRRERKTRLGSITNLIRANNIQKSNYGAGCMFARTSPISSLNTRYNHSIFELTYRTQHAHPWHHKPLFNLNINSRHWIWRKFTNKYNSYNGLRGWPREP